MTSIIKENLTKSGIIEQLRLNKKKYCNVKESKSLLAIYEQHAFVWHDINSCILTTELSCSENKRHKSKVLSLTNPPVFDVECIIFNQTGSLLALSGKNGVMIFEVPWRFGKFGIPGSEKDGILGRSWNIAESFFICSNRVGVVQVAWHPGSNSSTHLTVLSTDNYVRVYDVTDPQTPQQVVCLGGSTRSGYLNSESKISFSTCFGENAISFDFGPPEEIQVPKLDKLKLVRSIDVVTVWPIYLLHSNGDVYVVKAPMKKDKFHLSPKVLGPLTMYPPSEDNYGYDACYILCLHTTPLCIVITTATGIIYHCIVLENSNSSKAPKLGVLDFEPPVDSFDVSLYVFESVELPLTLTEEQDDVYTHPIRLYKDITSHSKYHCTHTVGLHSVAVPFLNAIEDCVEAGSLENLLTSEARQSCIVEHILCTKPFSQMDSIPVIGLDVTISDAGVNMISLLASWEFICFPLASSYFSSMPHLLSEKVVNPKEDGYSTSMFEQHIEQTLQRSVCCPYIKSDSSSEQVLTSPQQWLDLLYNATQRFREDYIQKLNTAQALLRSRIKGLIQHKEFQLRDIARSQQEKENLRVGAERLAEKYEDANMKQQKLMKRLESVLQKLQQNLPHLSKAEINMKQTLILYEDKLKDFESSLNQIKRKLKHQSDKLKETSEQVSSTRSDLINVNLTEVQTKRIKELLSKQGESISELMTTVNSEKKSIAV